MNNFTKRRNLLTKKLKNNSVLILFSGTEIKKSADGMYDFAVNRNFYYLTGVKQENSILIVTKTGNKVEEKLLLLPNDMSKVVWTGRRLLEEQAREISGVESILLTEDFDELLKNILTSHKVVYLDLEPGIFNHAKKETSLFGLELKASFVGVEIIDIYSEIINQRMIKDSSEIKLIKQSIELTRKALNNAMKKTKPGLYEYEVAALFEYGIKKYHGELGFSTIAAGGPNGVILHYPNLDYKLQDGDLLLLDLGGHNNMYTADISRTFPVNGKFSELQRKIYDIVLACNKEIINAIKPGLTLVNLNDLAKTFMRTKLIEANIMSEEEDIFTYYYHSVSHHLGLDTHDPGSRSNPIVPGNVITVEPGLYFSKYNIGIRIEDNILVTKDGGINLSSRILKEASDMER